MAKCLYCYKELNGNERDFHKACSKKIFGTLEAPILPYTHNNLNNKISPSIGVMKEDVKLPMFECFTSQNVTKAAPELSQNKPLEVVDYDVKDGVMTVLYKKNADYVGKSIGTTGTTGMKPSS